MQKKYFKKVLSGLSIVSLVACIMASTMVVSGCSKEEASAPGSGEKAKEAATPAYGEKAPGYGEKAPGYGEK